MSKWSAVAFTKWPPMRVSGLQSRAAVSVGQMSALSARSEGSPHARAAKLRDRAWLTSVDLLDGVLRWHYGVQEYTDDPDCVFRVAVARAKHPVFLSDGTFVHIGADVCHLHFWNEHLPRFPESGPDLGWAQAMRFKVRLSLQQLCRHLERDPAWEGVAAIRADAPLSLRPMARKQMQRLAQRHGFETATCEAPERGRVRELGENMLLWGFVRAYNPGALARRDLSQDRQPLLLSRKTLLARYGSSSQRSDDQSGG